MHVSECVSIGSVEPEISSKSGWGGPRRNSGGPRPNSGGKRPGAGRPRKIKQPDIWTPAQGLRWYVIRVKGSIAPKVAEKLQEKGFDSLYPRDEVLVQRRLRGKTVTRIVQRPLFPGYAFTQFDASDIAWRQIADIRVGDIRGVLRIFGSSADRPTPVPAGVVESLIAVYGTSGVLDNKPAPSLPALEAGTKVKLVGGAFGDWSAVVNWSSQKRVQVLLEIMGHQRRLELPRKMVQAV